MKSKKPLPKISEIQKGPSSEERRFSSSRNPFRVVGRVIVRQDVVKPKQSSGAQE